MNLGEFLNSNATQIGIPSDDAHLKSLLSSPSLSTITVPDELVSSFTERQKSLMTVEAAKQNPDLKKYFSAMALNIVDTELENTAKQLGLDEDTIKSIYQAEKYTNKRVAAITKKIEEAVKAKNALPPADDKKHDKLTAEIAGLNAQIIDIKKLNEDQIKVIQSENLNKLREYKYNEIFSNYDYTDALPKNVQAKTARNVFEEAVNTNNYKVVFEPETGNLRLLTNEDTEVFKNNKAVGFKDLLDSTLAENGLLKVTKTPAQPATTKTTPIQIASGERNTARMSEALKESAKAFEVAS